MTVRNLATLDRDIFQPLGRILQEAFADGFIGTGSITITKPFTGSSGYNKVMYLTGELDGGGGCAYGMFKFRTYVNSVLTADAHVICANLHFKDDAELSPPAPEQAHAPLYVTVETEITSVAPDLSGGNLAALYVGYYINEGVGAPAKAYVIHCNASFAANMGQWDGILNIQTPGTVGDSLSGADEATHVIGFDGDGITRKIPVLIGGATYYLLVGTAIQGVTDA